MMITVMGLFHKVFSDITYLMSKKEMPIEQEL